ncbi:hypothetical protein Cni_G17774 [Canna indica]|uniref:Endonuclease/exonuclease/phosphatase domain-containing protein n=1 Tax=Canna indica TaxID=4628 RepID=A0AAQ3QDU2_9LILI|nr:hypothetical protein Cni_G17774 [Canna indica]
MEDFLLKRVDYLKPDPLPLSTHPPACRDGSFITIDDAFLGGPGLGSPLGSNLLLDASATLLNSIRDSYSNPSTITTDLLDPATPSQAGLAKKRKSIVSRSSRLICKDYIPAHKKAELLHLQSNEIFWITRVYEPSIRSGRRAFIQELYDVTSVTSDLVIIGGYFNMTKTNSERLNCRGNNIDRRRFSKLIADCALLDLPSSGIYYTWTNNQIDHALAKLDRVLVNSKFWDPLPNARVYGVARKFSDHVSLLLHNPLFIPGAAHPFRIESGWISNLEFFNIIKAGLLPALASRVSHSDVLRGWISSWKSLHSILKIWNSAKRKAWKAKRLSLELHVHDLTIKADSGLLSSSDLLEFRKCKAELDALYLSEDQYWRQRAKKRWIKEGDRNTRYFHQCATIRRKRNWVTKILTPLGPLTESIRSRRLSEISILVSLVKRSSPFWTSTGLRYIRMIPSLYNIWITPITLFLWRKQHLLLKG